MIVSKTQQTRVEFLEWVREHRHDLEAYPY